MTSRTEILEKSRGNEAMHGGRSQLIGVFDAGRCKFFGTVFLRLYSFSKCSKRHLFWAMQRSNLPEDCGAMTLKMMLIRVLCVRNVTFQGENHVPAVNCCTLFQKKEINGTALAVNSGHRVFHISRNRPTETRSAVPLRPLAALSSQDSPSPGQ